MDMQPEDPIKMPTDQPAEWTLTVAKIAASFLPFAGGAAGELLEALIRPQLDKRRTEWFEAIARGLYELQQQVADVTPENIAQSEAFTSAFLHAGQIAMRTHQWEKIQALRNIVLHAALPGSSNDSLLDTFADDVDALTSWHLDLLQCLADPLGWADRRQFPVHDPQIDPVVMFEAVHRERLPAPDFERVLVNNLYNRGLATTGVDPYGPLYPQGTEDVRPRLTELGRQFLAYISTPSQAPDNVAATQEPGTPTHREGHD